MGRRHRPFYRVAAIDRRKARNGLVIEELGYYDPLEADADKQIKLKQDRIDYWISVGATPTDTVRSLIKRSSEASS